MSHRISRQRFLEQQRKSGRGIPVLIATNFPAIRDILTPCPLYVDEEVTPPTTLSVSRLSWRFSPALAVTHDKAVSGRFSRPFDVAALRFGVHCMGGP